MPVSLAAHSGAEKRLRTTAHTAVVCTVSASASHRAPGHLGLPHALKGLRTLENLKHISEGLIEYIITPV